MQQDDNEQDRTKSAASAPFDQSELRGRPLVRKERAGKALHASITSEQVSELVEAFYGKIRQHPRLSVLFSGGMTQDWPEHLEIMKGFWRSMLMQTREYGGRPVPAHMELKDLQPEDFAEWLSLFRQTAHEICPPEAAELYINRAETVARSLQMAVFLKGQIAPLNAFENGVMSDEFLAFFRRKQAEEQG